MNDFNTAIIEEFRANAGKVGGGFEGAPMVLLHTTGAKSGEDRVAPLVYRSEGDRVVIFASKGGAPTHPDWYHNIVANPVHVHDLQATILRLLGVDHLKLTYKFQGRHFRLTDVHGEVVKEVLA